MQQKSISFFEAKTNLSALLREAEKGQEFIVTNRGRPIAKIVPFEKNSMSEWDLFLISANKIRNHQKGKISIKSLIKEGRKY